MQINYSGSNTHLPPCWQARLVVMKWRGEDAFVNKPPKTTIIYKVFIQGPCPPKYLPSNRIGHDVVLWSRLNCHYPSLPKESRWRGCLVLKFLYFFYLKGCWDSLFAILVGRYILLALPFRINHGFLKPCFQAPGTLAGWFLTFHLHPSFL